MREIEIKLKVASLAQATEKLTELGCVLSDPKTQEDVNFVHKNDLKWFGKDNIGEWAYPRIRLQNGKSPLFTVKKPLKNEMDCLEYELQIDKPDEMRGVMALFDYIEGVTVKKTRRTCTFNNYTITLDQVDKLGDFIEIEQVVDDGDAEKIQEQMLEFASKTLGLTIEENVMRGYDILMHELIADSGNSLI